MIGVVMVVANLLWSIKHGRRAGSDPWKGNTSSGSPVAAADERLHVIPRVRSPEPMKDIRREVQTGAEAR